MTQEDQTNGPIEVEERIAIPENVACAVPDVGEYLLSWLGVDGPLLDEVAAEVNALRSENGWISLKEARRFPIVWKFVLSITWENGPLTFLYVMTRGDDIQMPVWAGYGLNGEDRHTVEKNVTKVLNTQGHAAAAAWALAARPEARLDLEFLANRLENGWYEGLNDYNDRDIRKSFKKWRR